jgi:hypothetical protein
VGPVAHGGIEAKMGAKKIDTMKQRPVVMVVSPVRPPSAIPAPLSMNAVTGEQPKRALMEMHPASQQKASVDRGKSPSFGSTTPLKRTIEYKVAVASMMSTYKKVKRATANCAPFSVTFQSRALRVLVMGWNDTTFLKKSKREDPSSVFGKYVMDVLRLFKVSVELKARVRKDVEAYGQERIETKAMPIMKAYLTRKDIRYAVKMPPAIIPVHIYISVSLRAVYFLS